MAATVLWAVPAGASAAAPTVSVADASVAEWNGPAVLTVTLGAASTETVTVPWTVEDGTATEDADYILPAPPYTLTFAPGERTKTIEVGVFQDELPEADETFFVDLGTPTNATVDDGRGQVTIGDDDVVSVGGSALPITEGDSGDTDLDFTVSLSQASGATIHVNYSMIGSSATAGADYTAIPDGALTFAPGETEKTVTVPVHGDTIDEMDETVAIVVSPVSGDHANGGGPLLGFIMDDDGPVMSISDASVVEGDSGTTLAIFTITRSSVGGPAFVDMDSADGTARAPVDYTPFTFDQISPGGLTSQVGVEVKGDTVDEPDETFTLTLSNPTHATLADAIGHGTIIDDDDPPPAPKTETGQQPREQQQQEQQPPEQHATVADTEAPAATLAAAGGLKLKKLLKGFRFAVSCDEACGIDVRLQAPRSALAKLSGAGATTTIARGHARLKSAGRATVKAKPSKRWSKKLKRLRKPLKLTLVTTVRDPAGNTRVVKKRVKLRR